MPVYGLICVRVGGEPMIRGAVVRNRWSARESNAVVVLGSIYVASVSISAHSKEAIVLTGCLHGRCDG